MKDLHGARMQEDRRQRFAASVLPHLDAAYNLARWLVRDGHDAEDVVQDAMLRALRHFDGLRGVDPRPWLLAIVRNAAWAWLRTRRPGELVELSDDELDAALAALRGTRLPQPVRTVGGGMTALTLTLASGFELRLGDPGDLRLKLAIARRILVSVGVGAGSGYLDVSVPERPVLNLNPQVSGSGIG